MIKAMKISHLFLILSIITCTISCKNSDNQSTQATTESQSPAEAEEVEVISVQKPKAFYVSLIDAFCQEFYSECFGGSKYVEGSVSVITIEYISNEEVDLVGTFTYLLPSGNGLTGQKFKAHVIDVNPKTGEYEVKFQKETTQILSSKTFWDTATKTFIYEG